MTNVREAALDVIEKINKNQAYSNLLLNETIKKHKLSRKDTGLLTEIVYGTIQRKQTLDFYLDDFLTNRKRIQTWVISLLQLSLYQMIYLDRVPDRAIIHEAVEIAKKRGHKGISGMVNGVLRNTQRKGLRDPEEIEDVAEQISIAKSHPLWLVKRWIDQLGVEATEAMCEENLLAPYVTARVNVSKTSIDQVIKDLEKEGVQAVPGSLSVDAIKVLEGKLLETSVYKRGDLTIQDESSMLVARALGIEPGQKVLDACAAPGGKSTHIAERLNGSGHVNSLDLHAHKVKLIKKQAQRLNLRAIEAETLDSRNVGDRFKANSFDRILVDAPCTGFGVLRRKPDIKWSKQEEDINRITSVQKGILDAQASLLKPGGKLVYSTCTIEETENQEVVKQFLTDHPEFKLDETLMNRLPDKVSEYCDGGQLQLLPHYFGTDGFYIACLVKK
ncbi:16S rRNA (cytosine(967)-C(5))-methyltransferase RsmB [Pseudalkalibacillus hwajinpoensis]|uniref:16S rRNA (cytosine(967)-C(5))-methyltransferase n=1 Tax=Guptibacillus hwajinpoensis TaxID=208199 RepID=A0A4U1MM19_9BACL|nr:16S rRNA (cytosine(967)-C(5))-methyltransferase RsmB [Pseudalkalibacillus hwajinpoensis]TKD71706.1 16S rRNA (cytosine(967)-C(5))-methyltransferase RsmB [Pseudalkalibacillus hwajinpoensis]